MRQTRRQLLRLGTAISMAGLAGCPGIPDEAGSTPTDQTDPTPTAPDHTTPSPTAGSPATASSSPTGTGTDSTPEIPDIVGLETVASGFTSPVAFVDLSEDLHYVVDQPGLLYAVDGDGRQADPALDIRDSTVDVSGYDERGLLGIALHPDFGSNRKLYLRYSAPRREGTPDNYSHTFVLSEFQASENGRSVDPTSERPVLEIPEPQANHNAGEIAFGPDGYLYVAVGDGGGADDQGAGHVDDWYDQVPGGNGQDIEQNLLGSILRIDPDAREGGKPYGIPDDNPLVGESGTDEHYAWGFRNPWRFSFTGDELFVADVGQNQYEEVDLVEKGGNYGWNVYEGTHCFGTTNCPDETPDGTPLRDPIIEYDHGGEEPNGQAVIGGYLYQGETIPGFQGSYVFGDWQAGGVLFVATRSEEGTWPVDVVDVEPADAIQHLLAFGRDREGEVYVATTEQQTVSGSTGALHRLVPV